jgi:hypothetical protein
MAKMYGYESPEEMMTSVTDLERELCVNPEDRRKFEGMIEKHGLPPSLSSGLERGLKGEPS